MLIILPSYLKNVDKLSKEEIQDIYNFMNVDPTCNDFLDDSFPCLHGRCTKSIDDTENECMQDYKKHIARKYGIEVSLDEHLIKQTSNYKAYLAKREQCSDYQFACMCCFCWPYFLCVTCCG